MDNSFKGHKLTRVTALCLDVARSSTQVRFSSQARSRSQSPSRRQSRSSAQDPSAVDGQDLSAVDLLSS